MESCKLEVHVASLICKCTYFIDHMYLKYIYFFLQIFVNMMLVVGKHIKTGGCVQQKYVKVKR